MHEGGVARQGASGTGAVPATILPRVLVVDDEPVVADAHARALRGSVAAVLIETDAERALARLQSEPFDVVVCDIQMPGLSGTELLRAVRELDLDLPVIFVTGAATVESAAAAVELGAFRYLAKPVTPAQLRASVAEAGRLRALAKARTGGEAGARAALESALRGAMTELYMVYQPIVAAETRVAMGHEALMRSRHPALRGPSEVLDAAEKLGSLHTLGRHIRSLVATDLAVSATTATIFVNLHSADLADPDLFDPTAPLSRFARQVVLEVTERASLEGIADLDDRREQLRELGYRVAVDDLGAGYAGLSYFARIKPELVKIDMSLVRDIDVDPVRQKVVLSLVSLSLGLGMEVVAEGVETAAERDTVVRLGCTFLQGYALARPGAPFPESVWS